MISFIAPSRFAVFLWLGLAAAEAFAVEPNMSPVSSESIGRLDRIFLGESPPKGIDDLKAMQERFQEASEKVKASTVGVQIGMAWGSGVIVNKEGYVLTAAHVGGKPNRPVVFYLNDGRKLKGRTLGANKEVDAGLMKIEGENDLPFAGMAAGEPKDGQWCFALGHPGGHMKDRGLVLRVGRVLLTDEKAITTDCTLVGGDSGGPLFNMNGHVIGINSRIAGAITANLHVPVDRFRESWDRLAKGDEWGHYPGQEPVIGVRGDPNAEVAKVGFVSEDSPAEKAGIQVGDVVLKFGSIDISDFASLKKAVYAHKPGQPVKALVQRGEIKMELTVILGRRGGGGDE